MKKIGLITLNGNNNFGNKLQHYAVQKIISNYSFDVETIPWFYDKKPIIRDSKDFIKYIIDKRFRTFKQFDKKIKYSKYKLCNNNIPAKLNEEYFKFVVGSDQVWNPNINLNYNLYLLSFANAEKRISLSASFGVDNIPSEKINIYKENLLKFNSISVREDSGKKIIKDLTGRNDVKVLLDPTMLLTTDEWDIVSKKPKKINKLNGKKYILNYFLGGISEERKVEIEKIAKKYDCKIINLLDKNDPFYYSGPSEFLYLEKNAFLICTDSFHSSVFAILYNRPFVVYDRLGMKQSINSRIDTLINKLQLENRKYNDKNITKKNINHDYTNAYKILQEERKKSNEFIRKALDIEWRN